MSKIKVAVQVEAWIWRAFENKVFALSGQSIKHIERAIEEALLDWIHEDLD